MTILKNLETRTDWTQPGNVGDTGGGSTKPSGVFAMTPAKPATLAVAAVAAQPAIFSAKGNYPYNDGYWFVQAPGDWSAITYFRYDLQFMLPTAADLGACQALEFELQQHVDGHIYNMAWQADVSGTKLWRTFDYNSAKWIPTAIPVTLTPGKWVSVEATFLRTPGFLTHVSISIDGITYPVNVTRPATAIVQSDYVHAAFQLDSQSAAPPPAYQCFVAGMNITMLATT